MGRHLLLFGPKSATLRAKMCIFPAQSGYIHPDIPRAEKQTVAGFSAKEIISAETSIGQSDFGLKSLRPEMISGFLAEKISPQKSPGGPETFRGEIPARNFQDPEKAEKSPARDCDLPFCISQSAWKCKVTILNNNLDGHHSQSTLHYVTLISSEWGMARCMNETT